jgi:hypothetical protein
MTELPKAITSFLHNFFNLDVYKYAGVRQMCDYVRRHMKGELVGVEIGVHQGINARDMLKRMNLKMLYLVDPYELYKGYDDGINLINMFGTFDKMEKAMQKRLKPYKNKYVHIKKMSENAVNDVPSNLDFVYVDGNHDYKHTLQDIELYYDKLKENGVIGGHDFDNLYLPEVRNAVIDFVQKKKLQLNLNGCDWWVVKKAGRIKNEEAVGKY